MCGTVPCLQFKFLLSAEAWWISRSVCLVMIREDSFRFTRSTLRERGECMCVGEWWPLSLLYYSADLWGCKSLVLSFFFPPSNEFTVKEEKNYFFNIRILFESFFFFKPSFYLFCFFTQLWNSKWGITDPQSQTLTCSFVSSNTCRAESI